MVFFALFEFFCGKNRIPTGRGWFCFALSGLGNSRGAFHPGRCPGLSYFRPSAFIGFRRNTSAFGIHVGFPKHDRAALSRDAATTKSARRHTRLAVNDNLLFAFTKPARYPPAMSSRTEVCAATNSPVSSKLFPGSDVSYYSSK
jgi:hypothetical protein